MKSSSPTLRILLFIMMLTAGISAQTIISTDTIWDTDQILTGDLIINSGVTLTVRPGVIVKVVKVDQDQNGQGDVDIIVNGSLVARGKPDSIIYFISYSDTATSDYHEWGGIDVGSSATVALDYSKIFCVLTGLDIAVNASVRVTHSSITKTDTGLVTVEANVSIENSSIIDAYSGIKVIQSNINTGHQFYLASSVIEETTLGIELTGTNTNFITRVDVIDPDSIGILIHSGSHTNTTVLSSHVYSQTLNVNTSDVAGISILDGTPEIFNTEVNGFYKGFNVESTSNNRLKYNYIHDNLFPATWLNGSTGTLEYSLASGNGTGPFIDDNSTPTINNNNLLDNVDIVGGNTIPTFGLWANNTNSYTSNDWPVPGNAGLQLNVVGAHGSGYSTDYHYVYVKESDSDVSLYTQYVATAGANVTDQWVPSATSTVDAFYVQYLSDEPASPYGEVPFVKVSGVVPSHLLCANDGLILNAKMNWWGQVSGVDGLVGQKYAGTVSYSNWKTQAIPDAGLQNVGMIIAIIKDAATGEVMPDVMVTNTEYNLILYSGSDGTFKMPGLLAGTYSFTYQKSGYDARNTTSTIPVSTDTLDLGIIYLSPTDSLIGPRVAGIFPENGTRSADSLQTVAIEVYDEDGVDSNSVRISINGVSYGLDSPALALNGSNIQFNIADLDSSFNDGIVSVSVDSVDDINGYYLQNPYNSTFYVDTHGPEIISTDPQQGENVSKSNQLVTVKIADEGDAIDTTSIVFQMTVNGVEHLYSISDAALIWNAVDSILIFDPSVAGAPFANGDSVAISLQVSDYIDLGNANSLAGGSYTWDFTVTILGDFSLQLHDHADNALDGVRVSIFRNGTVYREVSTDSTGSIDLALPPDSTYSVSFSKPGYFHYHISDISLNESTPLNLAVKLGQLGDYNVDGTVDFYDVDAIVSAYWEQDASIEFGPVEYNDTIPNFNVRADGVFDFEDIMIFTLIWNYHEGLSEATMVAFATMTPNQSTGAARFVLSERIGSEEKASQVQFAVVIEGVESLRSSRLVFKYDPTSLKYVSFQKTKQLSNKSLNKLMVLSKCDEVNGYLELDMANLSAQAIASGNIFGHLIFETMGENYGRIIGIYDIIDNQHSASRGKTEIISLPKEFVFHQNFPNPFNPTTRIRYEIPKKTKATLVIHNILGQEVLTINEGLLQPGYHEYVWNGRDSQGREMSSGIYIARLVTPEYTKSIKMLLLK